MEWLWVAFAVIGAWAMLSLIGNERQRQTIEAEASEKAAAASKKPEATAPAH